MERTMTIKKFFAPSTTRLGRQQWFRNVWQRLCVVLMLVMLTTATVWARETMTVTAENVTVTYDGNGHSITVNVSVPESGATITYCETENGTYTDTNPTYTNAGVNTVYYKVEQQVNLPMYWDDVQLDQTYRMDLVVNDNIIIELKAVNFVDKAHRRQLFNYMRLTHQPFGMLINFGGDSLFSEWYKRDSSTREIEKVTLL